MYLSHLLIDTGDNPDRPRPGRMWLRNVYHVHQRLWMAFPTAEQQSDDPQFLKPFQPERFEKQPFLFRVDNAVNGNGRRAIVLVQSHIKPNWDYAFQNAQMFLAAPPEVREFQPQFSQGQTLRFRIRMNLSKKASQTSDGTDLRRIQNRHDSKGRPKSQGKRVALTWDKNDDPEAVIREWFSTRGERCGFSLQECRLTNLGWVTAHRRRPGADTGSKDRPSAAMKFRAALLEGALTVAEPSEFNDSIANGIGSAKAFGFGLLSVAPA